MKSNITGIVLAGVLAMAGIATAATEVGNKICPISGHEVGGMGETAKVEYNGKSYNLCCSMCAKDFNKDPEAASKKAEAEVAGAAAQAGHEGHGH